MMMVSCLLGICVFAYGRGRARGRAVGRFDWRKIDSEMDGDNKVWVKLIFRFPSHLGWHC